MDENELMSYLDDEQSMDNDRTGNIYATEMQSTCLKDISDAKTDMSSSFTNIQKMNLNILNIRPEFDNERHFDACTRRTPLYLGQK